MQLSLSMWPPLVSHFMMFFLGTGVGHLYAAYELDVRIPRGQILYDLGDIHVPQSVAKKFQNLSPRNKAYVVYDHSCRLVGKPMRMFQLAPQTVVAIPIQQTIFLTNRLQRARDDNGTLEFLTGSKYTKLPVCKFISRVRHGS